ncbi:MAG TPA: hypothetical protein VJN21_08265 [Candidatus Acidoferrales bacterium]|nr:hypothetical protein [Candidatus Acidoferrales bacterium]
MEIVWVGLGISAVVGFVFYIMASQWARLLRSHSKAIRFLTQRVQALEEMEDSHSRRRLDDSAASPLEKVYIFSFRLSDRFWSETIGATADQMRYVREQGKFLGSAKIERWRSHITVTLTELLPQSQSAGWQTRTVDIYPGKEIREEAILWELHLEPPADSALHEKHPAIELRYADELLVLRTRQESVVAKSKGSAATSERVIFHVPLDVDLLSDYRVQEDEGIEDSEKGAGEELASQLPRADSWVTFYQYEDEKQGVDWQLCLRDLERKDAWEQLKVVEPQQARRAG